MRSPLALTTERNGMRRLSPYRAINELESEVESLLRAPLAWSESPGASDITPCCNFRETKKEYKMEFDIPGVKKEDVKIELEGNRLTISGERRLRRESKEDKDARNYLSEVYEGSFMRSFTMPSEVDADKVDAHFEDGVLTISVPKKASSKAKEIEIH